MEITEIYKLQMKCRKRAKRIVKRIYRRYDAIWIQRIRITPELEEMGGSLISRINAKMPNLLLKDKGEFDIVQTAERFGFATARELAEYLAAYTPRKAMEEEIYSRIAKKVFASLPADEKAVAVGIEPAALGKIIQECRNFAKEAVNSAYAMYDEVWYGRMRITPELLKHGKDVISEINRLMPNFLTHDPKRSALDQIAMQYKFESSQEVVDWLLEYTPRGPKIESMADELMRQALGLAPEGEEPELDEVPF